MPRSVNAKSVNPAEIANFSAMAEEWWDENGKFRPLHKFNPVRIYFIRDTVIEHFAIDMTTNESKLKPLAGLKLLDIGCGGGLLSEPMARMGATVTAADAGEKNIQIASVHGKKMGLDINYLCTTAESLADTGEQFDIILNMEVIEHVADLESFMQACGKMLKPGGIMFVATLNRTVKSYALAIVGAEYILGWLPKGTHNWKKFLRPSEVGRLIRNSGLDVKELVGATYNPLKDDWRLSKDLSVNYLMACCKVRQD